MIKKFKEYTLFLENIGSPLLSIENNVDQNLIEIIEKEVNTGGKILEISCGNGSDSLQLQKLGYQVTCTEFNPEYVENAIELGLDCYLHNTKDKFKFTDKEFDLVYSRLGLHYFSIDELNDILLEINRISKKILITVKIVDDIKTGKIMLTPKTWKEVISKHFEIKNFKIKEGDLYGRKSGWIEILADSIESKLEKFDFNSYDRPCVSVMAHELDDWKQDRHYEKFRETELSEIENMFQDYKTVIGDSTIYFEWESNQSTTRPGGEHIPHTAKLTGVIRKYEDEYSMVTLSEEVYRQRRNSWDHEVEHYICDDMEGLKSFFEVFKNKIKYIKKDLSINESISSNFPKELGHREALAKENSMRLAKLSDYQIDVIRKLIPEDYQLDVNEGGSWYDPDRKLAKTSATIHKNRWNQVTIKALEDEYFMIQRIRESKNTDEWWLCDGFDQVIEWLKWKY